jgi:hypothetical protein
MGSKLTSIKLTDEDQEMIRTLQHRYGLNGASQTIRFALKMTVAMPHPARSIVQSADIIDLSGIEGITLIRSEPLPKVSKPGPITEAQEF